MTLGSRPPATRLDDFDVRELISRGSFGVIHRVVHRSSGAVYALKQVQLSSMTRVERQEAIDEARMLSQLDHPFVIRHFDSFMGSDDVLHIVMDYAAGGTVYHAVRNKKLKLPEESRIWKWALQLLLGTAYIHSKRIIHRDIKSLNLFLDSQDSIKIGDFGIARALGDGTDMLRTIIGTPFYLSPGRTAHAELCEDKPYNEKTDIWAIGVCLYEMCMGKHPFTAQNEGALIRKILRGVYAPPSGCSAALLSLVQACLTFDASRRPTAAALLARADVVAQAKALGIPLDESALRAQRRSGQLQPSLRAAAGSDEDAAQHGAYSGSDSGAAMMRAHHVPASAMPPAQGLHTSAPPGHLFKQPASPHAHARKLQPAAGAALQPRAYAGATEHDGIAKPPQACAPVLHASEVVAPAGVACAEERTHPFAQHDFDAQLHGITEDIQNASLRHSRAELAHRAAHDAQQANVHACMADNVKGMLDGYPATRPRSARKLRPEAMPAAGARMVRRGAGAPYGQLAAAAQPAKRLETEAQQHEEMLWTAAYERPQFARKRCPDLMISGPTIRGGTTTNARAPQAPGVFAYEGSVTSTTTYVNPTVR